MASRLLSLSLRRLLLLPQQTQSHLFSSTPKPHFHRNSLAAAIWPLPAATVNLVPELNRYLQHNTNIRPADLQNVIRQLRKRRRFRQALQVSEWMKNQGSIRFTPSDRAIQLNLIGEVRGAAAAERYFKGIPKTEKQEKAYAELLNCYVRECLVEKSLVHLEKMKRLGFANSALTYNSIMSLYTNTGQLEKVCSVLWEMKNDGVSPDNFSYRICINSFGARLDIDGMEKVIEEMEQQAMVVVDWNTYTVVASCYANAGITDKAVSALKKAEGKLDIKDGRGYNQLIFVYGQLGYKDEMQRIWKLQKANCGKYTNRDYATMLEALVKLDEVEFEEAEMLLKEWESSGNSFDFRIPDCLFMAYRRKGLLDKAEVMIDDFLKKGKAPPSNSWDIIATGYAEKGEMAKAYKFMLNALCACVPNEGWEPKDIKVIKDILHYLGKEGDTKNVETFVDRLSNIMPMDRDMYHTLIRAHIRAGKGVDELRTNMKTSGIEETEETLEILSSKSEDISS